MRILLLIGTGGFIGSVLRYVITLAIQNRFLHTFPYGTLAVNIIGCFAIGLVFSFSEKGNLPHEWRLFLATGICGGFTTFSAFSIETLSLMRDGHMLPAILYVAASVLLGLLATFLGLSIVKIL